jgi:hypothetical protein
VTARYPRPPRVKVHVTQELIEQGVQSDSGYCMISEAIKEAVPDAERVSVDLQTIRFSIPAKGHRYTYLTPRIAQVPLVNFDYGLKPEPFSFQLRGGQVSRAGRRGGRPSGKGGDTDKASAVNPIRRARLVNRDHPDSMPERVGGRTPPKPAIPFSRRRQFGLRAFERPISPPPTEG